MKDFDIDNISEAVQEDDIVLLVAPSVSMQQLNCELARLNEGEPTILATVSQSYSSVTARMREENLEPNEIFFIDCSGTSNATRHENVVYNHPENLTAISIAVSEALRKLAEGDGLFIFQNLGSLRTYNKEKTLTRFVHHITEKFRNKGMGLIMVVSDTASMEDFVGQVSQFADNTIYLEEHI